MRSICMTSTPSVTPQGLQPSSSICIPLTHLSPVLILLIYVLFPFIINWLFPIFLCWYLSTNLYETSECGTWCKFYGQSEGEGTWGYEEWWKKTAKEILPPPNSLLASPWPPPPPTTTNCPSDTSPELPQQNLQIWSIVQSVNYFRRSPGREMK